MSENKGKSSEAEQNQEYTDHRREAERYQACKNTSNQLMKIHPKADIWSQLICSDPGQIFWDSFIVRISDGNVTVTRQGRHLFTISNDDLPWSNIVDHIKSENGAVSEADKNAFQLVRIATEKRRRLRSGECPPIETLIETVETN